MKLLFLLAASLYAESKDQAALRLAAEQHARDQAQIAKVTADLASAAASRAEMMRSIQQLNANNQQRAAEQKREANSKARTSEEIHTADASAVIDAANLQNERTMAAAAEVKAQSDILIKIAENASNSMYVAMGTAFSALLTALVGLIGIILSHYWSIKKIDEVGAKVDVAGADAHAAYTEANTVNQKIEKIGLKMADDRPLNPNSPQHK
jgi:hypothetical protein